MVRQKQIQPEVVIASTVHPFSVQAEPQRSTPSDRHAVKSLVLISSLRRASVVCLDEP